MPIVNRPVTPHVNPPYRGKLTQAGGLRCPDDWHRVVIHQQNNGAHLVAHDQHWGGDIVLEIHDSMSDDGTHELEECKMTTYFLTPQQRFDLAVYLLSTIEPRGK
ncbi:hypothetical protein [Vibrio phage F23s2]|uniref:Uncharacterized protein n=1 Tax=Vibrio phage F23s2 TaxID=2930328 RepID=A0AAE9HD20_9CAUD|nr:hypothetical protein [Vibrio phage F23s2]